MIKKLIIVSSILLIIAFIIIYIININIIHEKRQIYYLVKWYYDTFNHTSIEKLYKKLNNMNEFDTEKEINKFTNKIKTNIVISNRDYEAAFLEKVLFGFIIQTDNYKIIDFKKLNSKYIVLIESKYKNQKNLYMLPLIFDNIDNKLKIEYPYNYTQKYNLYKLHLENILQQRLGLDTDVANSCLTYSYKYYEEYWKNCEINNIELIRRIYADNNEIIKKEHIYYMEYIPIIIVNNINADKFKQLYVTYNHDSYKNGERIIKKEVPELYINKPLTFNNKETENTNKFKKCIKNYNLIKIPAGEAYIGENTYQYDDTIETMVYISLYYISRDKVVYKDILQYLRTLNKQDYELVEYARNHPEEIAEVDWNIARGYCKYLYSITGIYFDLITEAEWEKAARGGIYMDGDDYRKYKNIYPKRKYLWSSDIDTFTLNKNNKYINIMFSPYDIAGMYNGSEWLLDNYDSIFYQHCNYKNPACLEGINELKCYKDYKYLYKNYKDVCYKISKRNFITKSYPLSFRIVARFK